MTISLKNSKSITVWLICLAYTSLFFSIKVNNIALGILLVCCLVMAGPKLIWTTVKDSAISKIMIAFYLIHVAGLLYTSNYHEGFLNIEKKASLLLVPLLVLPVVMGEGIVNLILKRVGYITMGSGLLLLLNAVFKLFLQNDSRAFFFEDFTSIHYVYYSLYFACGSLLLMDSVFNQLIAKKYGALVLSGIFIYSLVILVLVASKTGILTYLVASMCLLFFKIPNKRTFAITIVLLFLSAFLVLYFNKTTQNRFTELSEHLSVITQSGPIDPNQVTDLNMRLLFWKISINHVFEDGLWLTGLGTGDAQDYLNALYTQPAYSLYGYVGWNSHNQWVFSFIQLGVFAVLILAILYSISFAKALRHRDVKFISFLIITLGFSMSECILESNKGIVFCALFFTLMAAPYSTKIENAVIESSIPV